MNLPLRFTLYTDGELHSSRELDAMSLRDRETAEALGEWQARAARGAQTWRLTVEDLDPVESERLPTLELHQGMSIADAIATADGWIRKLEA